MRRSPEPTQPASPLAVVWLAHEAGRTQASVELIGEQDMSSFAVEPDKLTTAGQAVDRPSCDDGSTVHFDVTDPLLSRS